MVSEFKIARKAAKAQSKNRFILCALAALRENVSYFAMNVGK
jgi:hypothetical protein